MSRKSYGELRREAEEYYALVRRARDLGIPIDARDPRSPKTTAALRAAIRHALEVAA